MQNEKDTNEIDETTNWEEYERKGFRFGRNSKRSILWMFGFVGIGLLPGLYFALKAIIKDKDKTGYFGLLFFTLFFLLFLLIFFEKEFAAFLNNLFHTKVKSGRIPW